MSDAPSSLEASSLEASSLEASSLGASSLELSPELADLAAAYGVATEYSDWRGRHVRVDGATIHAVLAALGIDTSTPAATDAALEERRNAPWRRLLPPCVVTTGGREAQLLAHAPAGAPVEVLLELEDGARRADVPVGEAALRAAAHLKADVEAWALRGGEDYELLLTVAPDRAAAVAEAVAATGTPVAVIGEVTADPEVVLVHEDGAREPFRRGWDHFAAGSPASGGPQH